MPNWCENRIEISGKESEMKVLIEKLNTLIENKSTHIMEDLLELTENDKPTNYHNEGWYDFNCKTFGTKWDFGVEDTEFQIDKSFIYFNVLTAWAPPGAFLINLCKKYKVTANITYYEPGMDFSGRSVIDVDGNILYDEDCAYLEGIHRYSEDFDYYIDDYINMWAEDNTKWNEITKWLSFLSKDELKEIKKSYKEKLKELKTK